MLPLCSAETKFVDFWNGLGTEVAPEVSVGACAEPEDEAAEQTVAPVSKVEEGFRQTLAGHTNAVIVLLRELNSEDPKTKEKDFTPILGKLFKFKQSLLESPVVGAAAAVISASASAASPAPDLLSETDRLVNAASSAKQMMRSFKEYRKSQKVASLMNCLPHLRTVATCVKAAGMSMGAWFGSALVKGAYLEVAATNPVEALSNFAPEKFDYEVGPKTERSIRTGEIVADCLTTKLYDNLKPAVHSAGAESPEEWAKTKDGIKTMAVAFDDFAAEHEKSLGIAPEVISVLGAFRVVCQASTKDESVGPSELQKALL